MSVLPWLILPCAYFLGGISPGYWLVRVRTGVDLRTQGSGATGATNAARLLGRGGFILVLALDAAKGALAVLVARAVGLTGGWEFSAATACIAGHVWPVQLGFRGGRGLGPLLGAWLVLAPLAIGICLLVAGALWGVTKRRVPSGLFGAFLLPFTTWWDVRTLPAVVCTVGAFCIVAIAHRSHFQTHAVPPGTA